MVRTPACHAPCKDDANCRDNYLSSAWRGPGADNRRPPASQPTVTRALSSLAVLAAAVALAALAGARPDASAGVGHDPAGAQTEVVVQLSAPPLARAGGSAAVRRIAAEQRTFTIALRRSIPGARVRWRYRHVANGLAVALPRTEVSRLPGLPGVTRVYADVAYHPTAGPDAATIHARDLPGATLGNAGAGIKIGVIDDGVDQRHAFFDPAGYTMPAGFPKGQAAFTTREGDRRPGLRPAGRGVEVRESALRP